MELEEELMRNPIIRAVVIGVCLALMVVACDSDGDSNSGDAPSSAFCAAVEKLGEAVDRIDGDSIEEFRTSFDEAQAAFDDLRASDGAEQFAENLDEFGAAFDEFEQELLTDEPDEGLLGGILGIAEAADQVDDAYDVLDEKVDCPNT